MNPIHNNPRFFDIGSSEPLGNEHTHIFFNYAQNNNDLEVDEQDIVQARKKIVQLNLAAGPNVKALNPTSIHNNRVKSFGILDYIKKVAFSLKHACEETVKEGWGVVALHVAGVGLLVLICVGFGALTQFTNKLIMNAFNRIGTTQVVRQLVNGQWQNINRLYTRENYILESFLIYILDAYFCIFLGIVLCGTLAGFSNSNFTKYYDQGSEEFLQDFYRDSFSRVARLHTVPAPMANIDLDKIVNQRNENGLLIDPISKESIGNEKLRSVTTLQIGNRVFTHTSALNAIFARTFNQRNKGEIPHPFEDRMMTPEEQEKFLDDVALLMCEDKEAIRSCWNVGEQDITDRAIDILANKVLAEENDQDAGVDARDQNVDIDAKLAELKDQLLKYEPGRRFALLPTSKLVFHVEVPEIDENNNRLEKK